MVGYTEPALLTLLDITMIIGVIVGMVAVPALLLGRQFKVAAKTALMVVSTIAANFAVHAAVSLIRS